MNLKTLKLLISCFMLLFMNTVVWGQKQEIPLRKNKKQNAEKKYLKVPVKSINNIQAYYDKSRDHQSDIWIRCRSSLKFNGVL